MLNYTGINCAFCGCLVRDILFVQAGNKYCCESCFLKEKELRLLEAIRDNAYLALANSLVLALDASEYETAFHSRRVAYYTLRFARRFSGERGQLCQIYYGALLHDIGKISIQKTILLKPGPLTDVEWNEIKRHPEIGYNILKDVPFMAEAAEIVWNHQEHYDGSGYPRRLSGKSIPLGARIFTLVDAIDAMTSERPYRKRLSFEDARVEILRLSGIQFDPQVVDVFIVEEGIFREMRLFKYGDFKMDITEREILP